MNMKKKTIKTILIAGIFAIIITVLAFLTVKFKIELHNPDASIVVKISVNDEQREIPAKRFDRNKVFANFTLKEMLELDKIYLYIPGSPGAQTVISDIQLTIGNTPIRTYRQMNEEAYIETKNLLVDDKTNVITLQTENPYIFLYMPSMKLGAVRFCLKVFLVSFVLSIICMTYLQKKRQLIKNKIQQLAVYVHKSYKGFIGKSCIFAAVLGVIYLLMIQNTWITCPWMDAWEILFFVAAFILLSFQLKKRTKNQWAFIICEMILAVFLLMSILDLTSYLTVDEENSILEQSNFQSSDFRHWLYGESYMNFSIMGTIWQFVPRSIVEQGLITELQLGKLLHWLCGIILIGMIAGEIEIYLADTKKRYDRAVVYTIMAVTALSLPVTLMAIKNYNYDMFAMLFGVLGTIEVCIYAKDKSQGHGWAGVLFLTCGMLEKMIVFPVWYVGIAIVVFVRTEKYSGKEAVKKMIQYVVLTFAVILLITYTIEAYTLGILRDVSPIYSLKDSLLVLLQIPGMGFRAIGDILDVQIPYHMTFVISAILYIVGEIIIAGILHMVWSTDICRRNYKVLNRLCIVPQLLFLTFGVLNRCIFALDKTKSMGAAYVEYCSIFTEALPTMLLVLIVIALVIELKTDKFLYYGMIQLLASCVMAVIYVITGWTNARYADLYLLLYALLAVTVVSNTLYNIQKVSVIFLIIASGINGMELAGSQPAFTYFIPYWGVIPAEIHGRELAAYWGENWQIMLDVMDEYCKENGLDASEITLHCSYPGKVLDNDTEIQIGQYWWRLDGYADPTEQDYFVFETRSVINGQILHGLPEDVKPVKIVKYHGAVTARIYRGDTLQEYFQQYY